MAERRASIDAGDHGVERELLPMREDRPVDGIDRGALDGERRGRALHLDFLHAQHAGGNRFGEAVVRAIFCWRGDDHVGHVGQREDQFLEGCRLDAVIVRYENPV